MTERRSYPKKGNRPLTSVLGTYRKTPTVSGVASLTDRSKCMHAKSLQACLTLCDPMDDSPSGSSILGIPQARVLEWVAIPFSWVGKGLNPLSHVSCIGRQGSLPLATPRKPYKSKAPKSLSQQLFSWEEPEMTQQMGKCFTKRHCSSSSARERSQHLLIIIPFSYWICRRTKREREKLMKENQNFLKLKQKINSTQNLDLMVPVWKVFLWFPITHDGVQDLKTYGPCHLAHILCHPPSPPPRHQQHQILKFTCSPRWSSPLFPVVHLQRTSLLGDLEFFVSFSLSLNHFDSKWGLLNPQQSTLPLQMTLLCPVNFSQIYCFFV